MELFELMAGKQHEQLVLWTEPRFGYKGIISLHDTSLGPGLGGTRLWNYATEEEALVDALRLARGMTYKAAVTGLTLGGGKSVIWGDPKIRGVDREMLFRAHGRAVESLGGRYITAEDVGTSPADMAHIALETEHVVGLEGTSGDPSPVTAYGVYRGIKAAAMARYGDDSLDGLHVAVQGLGQVGYHLCENLRGEGARLSVTDIDSGRIERVVDEFDAEAVVPEDIFDVDADIFAPCALGAVLNDDTIPRLKVDIVAGAANNQLASTTKHGPALQEAGILYAPDYVINAGGLINVYGELQGWTREQSLQKAGEIYDTLLQVFQLAENERVSPEEAAARAAEERIQRARHLQRTYLT
jgi:leucine dehydrogenase